MSGALAGRCAGTHAAAPTSCASKRHVVLPSSSTMLFHRRPTIRRPVTFLTVQKSQASSSTQRTKMLTKLLENHEPNMYTTTARVCERHAAARTQAVRVLAAGGSGDEALRAP